MLSLTLLQLLQHEHQPSQRDFTHLDHNFGLIDEAANRSSHSQRNFLAFLRGDQLPEIGVRFCKYREGYFPSHRHVPGSVMARLARLPLLNAHNGPKDFAQLCSP